MPAPIEDNTNIVTTTTNTTPTSTTTNNTNTITTATTNTTTTTTSTTTTNNNSSNNNNNSNNNTNTNDEKPDRSEQMWKVLKAHILRERARKKQEREAEVEEERLRKEREAREQQDVMTLGETREQISQLETKLQQLKEEKHQLFLQLKKVLNEDDNRRRQLVKENSELMAMQAIQTNMVHPQLYIAPTVPRNTAMAQPQASFKATVKRPRSPSPQPTPPVSLYHQGYSYKPTTVGNTHQSSPQKDESRRHELVRAVLWNKTPQYSNQPSTFYPVAPQELVYYPFPPLPRESGRTVYETVRPQGYHLEQKIPDHGSLRPATTHGHVMHTGSITSIPQQQPKAGGITGGYPVRSQTQYQQAPPSASSLYTTQTTPLYRHL